MGINLVVSTLVGVLIGKGLDSFFGTAPYLIIVFSIFGVIAGFIELFRNVKKVLGTNESDNGQNDNGQNGKWR